VVQQKVDSFVLVLVSENQFAESIATTAATSFSPSLPLSFPRSFSFQVQPLPLLQAISIDIMM
jgi:hypothetical protein